MAAIVFFVSRPLPRCNTSGPIPEDVYVWQRVWNDEVHQSLQTHGHSFRSILALHAEVRWSDQNEPLSHIPLNFRALGTISPEVGLVLRLGPYTGNYEKDDKTINWLIQICRSMIDEANKHQMQVSELQIDFDCAESKLAGYLLWLQSIRSAIAPVPLTITALPSWMDQKEFQKLIRNVDGYVLQVHSVTPPRSTDQQVDLCPPDAARKAVEIAGSYDIPFRVALPTYGYLIAFDPNGNYVGLSAETLPSDWPNVSSIKETWSDPKSIAGLVSGWEQSRPCNMQGLIWFRMPVEGDRMNWSWQTLNAVREGRIPSSKLAIDIKNVPSGLVEVFIKNLGDAASFSPPTIHLNWDNENLIEGSGINGFTFKRTGSTNALFFFESNGNKFRMEPDVRKPVGWLLLEKKTSLQTKLSFPPQRSQLKD